MPSRSRLVRRFRDQQELPPVYICERWQSRASAIEAATNAAREAGYTMVEVMREVVRIPNPRLN